MINLTRYKLEWFNRTTTMENFHQMIPDSEGSWVQYQDVKSLLIKEKEDLKMKERREIEEKLNQYKTSYNELHERFSMNTIALSTQLKTLECELTKGINILQWVLGQL